MFQAFNVVFQKAIARADPSDDVGARVNNLIECISFSVFQYTTRGLFECDKLIFAAQMTFQVFLIKRKIKRFLTIFSDIINERGNISRRFRFLTALSHKTACYESGGFLIQF